LLLSVYLHLLGTSGDKIEILLLHLFFFSAGPFHLLSLSFIINLSYFIPYLYISMFKSGVNRSRVDDDDATDRAELIMLLLFAVVTAALFVVVVVVAAVIVVVRGSDNAALRSMVGGGDFDDDDDHNVVFGSGLDGRSDVPLVVVVVATLRTAGTVVSTTGLVVDVVVLSLLLLDGVSLWELAAGAVVSVKAFVVADLWLLLELNDDNGGDGVLLVLDRSSAPPLFAPAGVVLLAVAAACCWSRSWIASDDDDDDSLVMLLLLEAAIDVVVVAVVAVVELLLLLLLLHLSPFG
jgi:hypothetical protein